MNATLNEIERLLIKHHDACAKVKSHPKPCLSDPTLKSPQYWREDVVIAAMTELLSVPTYTVERGALGSWLIFKTEPTKIVQSNWAVEKDAHEEAARLNSTTNR